MIILTFVFCILTMGINLLVQSIMTKKIASSDSAARSVKIRNIYRYIRLLIIIVFTVGIAILVFALFDTMNFNTNAQKYILVALFGLIALTYSSMSLPVSGMTMDKFHPRKDFALFLRGFGDDNYEPCSEWKSIVDACSQPWQRKEKPNPSFQPFSEQEFCKALKKYMPVYSVGMTKELTSPVGSKRIYLDDDTWKDDVLSLIKRAKLVFILLHNSNSCIWEILQCDKEASSKTIYFVEGEKVFKEIMENLHDEAPEVLSSQSSIIEEIGNRVKKTFMDASEELPNKMDYGNLNDEMKKELEEIFNFLDNNDKIKVDDKMRLEIIEAFLEMKAKLHRVIYSDGKENWVMEFENTENGFSKMLRTIFADRKNMA